jgi:hypothetical protein
MKWLTKLTNLIRSKKRGAAAPVVNFDDQVVSCRFPDGTIQQISWGELKAVVIETNDRGPWEEDVYFILFSDSKEHFCAIPQCSKGTQELLARLQQLAGFDNEAVISSMGCTSKRSFLCWEKKGWVGENWPGIVAARNYRKG